VIGALQRRTVALLGVDQLRAAMATDVDVAPQRPEPAARPVQKKWQMVGNKSIIAGHDPGTERMGLDQVVSGTGAGEFVVLGDVHEAIHFEDALRLP